MITSCQMTRIRAMARSFGQSAAQALRASRPGSAAGGGGPSSSLSRPVIAADRRSVAMTAHLLPQPVGDGARQFGDVEGIDPARLRPRYVILLDDPAGP